MFSESDFEIYRHAWRFAKAPDDEPQLSDSQCKTLLRKDAWLVRNTYDFDCREETNFWYVIKDSFGGMEELSGKDRKSVNKALSLLEYRIVDKHLIENQGYEIAKRAYDAFEIQNARMNEQVFENFLINWGEKNCDFWGVFDKNDERLVGFGVVIKYDTSCSYDMACILPEYRNNCYCVFYGMYYTRNEYYLGENKYKYVTDGTRSVTEHSNVQPFLIQKFKFRKAYCKLKIRYKWWFGIIVRMLLPFRNIIRNRNVKAVLNMHKMQY